MSVVTPPFDSAIPPVPVWRISVERYHEMVGSGLLTPGDRLELLEGWLVQKMTQNPPHRAVVYRLREAFHEVLPSGWYADAQVPITLATSEPEPDAIVVRGASEEFLDRHPGPRELALVVEVADTTLAQDRGLKKRMYAGAAIPCYWIANLPEQRVEVYSDPAKTVAEADYRGFQSYSLDEEVPLVLDGREVCRLPVSGLVSQ